MGGRCKTSNSFSRTIPNGRVKTKLSNYSLTFGLNSRLLLRGGTTPSHFEQDSETLQHRR